MSFGLVNFTVRISYPDATWFARGAGWGRAREVRKKGEKEREWSGEGERVGESLSWQERREDDGEGKRCDGKGERLS